MGSLLPLLNSNACRRVHGNLALISQVSIKAIRHSKNFASNTCY